MTNKDDDAFSLLDPDTVVGTVAVILLVVAFLEWMFRGTT